ncbi:MAG: acyl-CoA carboxylase subunit beta [Acidobacteriia bacterium]|nr:acyl-CoA carboxylase subunit beta [Terriglobia bacterium]
MTSTSKFKVKKPTAHTPVAPPSAREHLEQLVRQWREIEERVQQGGGAEKIEKQHKQRKLTARERVHLLFDAGTLFQEVGSLVAYDLYEGQAPAAGVVTGFGLIRGRECVVVANDATVKAGSWWPETIKKILRAQEIAMRCHVPIVYLVDSAGVNLPYQGGVFPGQYGAGRIFYYNSIMRRYLKVPQLAAVMGPCVAGGAYLPALSDVMIMTEQTSFMGLGGPNLVKGATGQTVDAETLGGAWTHNAISGVAHYRAKNDEECLEKLREMIAELPPAPSQRPAAASAQVDPIQPPGRIYDLFPLDHRQQYDMRAVLDCLIDAKSFDEFQADYAREMICGHARLCGVTIGLIANYRGILKPQTANGSTRFGGIIYTESAEKVAYFIETCARQGTPILFVQDVSGFMVGTEAEQSGIIRAGARFVEAMSCAGVPKIVLTLNHASGAGYYAMAGQGFDPDFIFTWPTGRMGVMEGDSAVQAAFGTELEKLERIGKTPDGELEARMVKVRGDYDHQLDAKFAAARGFVDAIIAPEDTRQVLSLALRTALNNAGPHLGPFGL